MCRCIAGWVVADISKERDYLHVKAPATERERERETERERKLQGEKREKQRFTFMLQWKLQREVIQKSFPCRREDNVVDIFFCQITVFTFAGDGATK